MKVNPWQDLARQGLLSGAEPKVARIGDALTGETRAGLLDSLERLDEAGVQLRYDRRIGPDKHLTPAEALARLEEARPEKPLRLEATTPDGTEVAVACLTDLESLEYRHGAGADGISEENRALALALKGVEAAGMDVISEYEVLARKGEEFPFGESVQQGQGWSRIESREELLAMNYLMGDGEDHGLADPAAAQGVRDLYSRGLSVMDWYGSRSDAFEAWRSVQAAQGAWVAHERLWGPWVPGNGWSEALADVPQLERATAEAEAVGDRRLGGLYEPTVSGSFAQRYAMQTVHPLQDWTLDEAARAYAEINEALQDPKRDYLEERARSLYEVLAEHCRSGAELTRAAQALGREIRDGDSSDENALRVVEDVVTRPAEEVARLVEAVEGPPSASGDVEVGREEVRIGEVTLPIA